MMPAEKPPQSRTVILGLLLATATYITLGSVVRFDRAAKSAALV